MRVETRTLCISGKTLVSKRNSFGGTDSELLAELTVDIICHVRRNLGQKQTNLVIFETSRHGRRFVFCVKTYGPNSLYKLPLVSAHFRHHVSLSIMIVAL